MTLTQRAVRLAYLLFLGYVLRKIEPTSEDATAVADAPLNLVPTTNVSSMEIEF